MKVNRLLFLFIFLFLNHLRLESSVTDSINNKMTPKNIIELKGCTILYNKKEVLLGKPLSELIKIFGPYDATFETFQNIYIWNDLRMGLMGLPYKDNKDKVIKSDEEQIFYLTLDLNLSDANSLIKDPGYDLEVYLDGVSIKKGMRIDEVKSSSKIFQQMKDLKSSEKYTIVECGDKKMFYQFTTVDFTDQIANPLHQRREGELIKISIGPTEYLRN